MSRSLRVVLLVSLLFALCAAGAAAGSLGALASSSPSEPNLGQPAVQLTPSVVELTLRSQGQAPAAITLLYLPAVLRQMPPTPTPTATPTATNTPPAPSGIYGRVTYNGSPVAGLPLDLRRWDGSSYTTERTTTTSNDGSYVFAGAPTLPAGHSYYVRYLNNSGNTNFVSGWYNPDITAYTAGQGAAGGDFDVANIMLSSPPSGYSSVLPITFQWVKRSVPGDTYRWTMFDLTTLEPWYTNDLGPVDTYVLTSLPNGASFGKEYGWYVMAYQGPNSYGDSYFYRRFTATGGNPPEANRASLRQDKPRMGERNIHAEP